MVLGQVVSTLDLIFLSHSLFCLFIRGSIFAVCLHMSGGLLGFAIALLRESISIAIAVATHLTYLGNKVCPSAC